jgi:hypothetical protein
MSEEKEEQISAGAADCPEPWTFEANRSLQIRMGLKMTPAERLRWLEETVEELRPWVGRALLGRPVGPTV